MASCKNLAKEFDLYSRFESEVLVVVVVVEVVVKRLTVSSV